MGTIQAAGLTESQLEEEIRKTLSPNILRDPSVTVTMLTSQQRAFSILGNGVPLAGPVFIPRYDFRLMDALATAQVQMQFNTSHIYVSRREEAAEGKPAERQERSRVPELETHRARLLRRADAAGSPWEFHGHRAATGYPGAFRARAEVRERSGRCSI